MQRFQESLALLDVVERSGVDERLGQALGEWGGDIVEEEAVEDGEKCSYQGFKMNGRTPMEVGIMIGEEGKVKALLTVGADIEAVNEYGNTPLLCASLFRNESVVKVLLEAGANTEARDEHGATPLHTAAYWGDERVAKLLLEAGANVEAVNKNGATPLHRASID